MNNYKKRMMMWGVGLMLLQPSMGDNRLLDTDVPGKRLSLQQCLELAGKQSLAVQAGRKSVERAKMNEGTAWDVDKTEIALSQDPSSGGSVDNAVSLSQSIDFPTVYSARRKQLKAETQAEQSRLDMVVHQQKNKITASYYLMLYHAHWLQILQKQDSILQRYCDVAKKRFKAGEGRQLEFLTAEEMCDENRLEIVQAKDDIENEQLKLMALLNTDERILPLEKDLLVLPLDMQGGFSYAQTPSAQFQHDRIAALDRAVKAENQGYAPSLSLSLRTQAVMKGWNPYHVDRSRFDKGNFMGFELGVGVPLFYGATKAKVRAAKKSKEVAQMEMLQEQKDMERDYSLCLNNLRNAESRLKHYEKSVEEKADKMVSLSTAEYEGGDIAYVEYVNALKEAVWIRKKRAEAVNDYNMAVIALWGLMGQ